MAAQQQNEDDKLAGLMEIIEEHRRFKERSGGEQSQVGRTKSEERMHCNHLYSFKEKGWREFIYQCEYCRDIKLTVK